MRESHPAMMFPRPYRPKFLRCSRKAYKSFSRSARHILQLIASHQNLQTGWAYLSYLCLSDESGLTRRRVIQLVAFLEENHALEVHRGHGRGHANFYRILREEDGLPVPHRAEKKVKSETPLEGEKVKFPTAPAAEKVKSKSPKPLELLLNLPDKVIDMKEKEKKGAPLAPVSPSAEDGVETHEELTISPEVMERFYLRYNVADWPPPRWRDD